MVIELASTDQHVTPYTHTHHCYIAKCSRKYTNKNFECSIVESVVSKYVLRIAMLEFATKPLGMRYGPGNSAWLLRTSMSLQLLRCDGRN